ncbi:MAG: spermidine/putrescine transport system permease protein [Actinomycetota bacterium]|nr:spermidine/putrescine transport system permease protein [Actinomycetota bacterium]
MLRRSATRSASKSKRDSRSGKGGVWYPRWFWPSFAAPGFAWLGVFFVLPFYVVLSIAFGTVDPIFRSALPVYEPWYWTGVHFSDTFAKIFGANAFFQPAILRTLLYVVAASLLCLVIGYAVAYYVARYGGRRKALLLVLLISPFWISYLMRMLAWVNLLQDQGYVNDILRFLHLISAPVPWLEGKSITVILGLVYGYIPYMILPLYAFLDRIDQSLLEAGRDLGASPVQTFLRVTLPLSKPAILAGMVIVSLPMFGDYYTNNLLSNSPKTTMFGNIIDDAVGSTGRGPEAAVLVVILMVFLIVPMIYYMRSTARSVSAE